MGCDIHLHTEIKINGQWIHHSEANVKRNYALFAKMAGVRNHYSFNILPISKPKGLPRDCSFLTRIIAESWEGDAHNHSWLGAKELYELEEFIKTSEKWFGENCLLWTHYNFPYLNGNTFGGFWEYPDSRIIAGIPIEDVRFVFWFDN